MNKTVTNANDMGFLPGNDAYENSLSLQMAVDKKGEIIVNAPGVYEISEQIEIGSDTVLSFSEGVILKRMPSRSGKNGNAFINKGALKKEYDSNIEIRGLHLECAGVESDDFGVNSRIVGLRAQVAMIYVRNLKVTDFWCHGLLKKDYAIQISAFENIYLDGLYISGDKDGVHLGWGSDFVIRNGKFCTYDDPIALNAFDYATSNTHVGWIENGLIENCTDLDADTVGFFCRILAGAWVKWYKGMKVQHSDTVAVNGRTYRVVMNPTDGKLYTSLTPPSHEKGVAEYDGISWTAVRDTEELDCGCRNIVIRNCILQKKRFAAIAFSMNSDTYAKSYYPGCRFVPQSNIVLDNIRVEGDVKYLLHSTFPSENVTIRNIDLKNTALCFERIKELSEVIYPTVNITAENVKFYENSVISSPGHKVEITEKV